MIILTRRKGRDHECQSAMTWTRFSELRGPTGRSFQPTWTDDNGVTVNRKS